MSKITSIGKEDVHRITSGQVIVDLSTAVKELVENSLDANARKIEVIFKNYGLDSIEVNDDGDGIDEEDFKGLALKHFTSKLSSFEDVAKISTLGFRGEAMSSLCAISNVKVITTKTPPKAHTIEYDHSGDVLNKTVCSRPKGTSVIITDLFNNLPVRRKDFNKNSKKEFSKCLSLLHSYALISLNVKIIVSNTTPKGKKNVVLSSQGNSSLKNNIINVFGSNGMYGLIPIDFTLDLNQNKSRLKILDHSIDYTITVNGFISKCSFGFGRSATDRQLFFINNRPVALQPFAKAINEVYKSFNHIQYPVIILNLKLDSQFLDVNVTPDKRTVLIHNENHVLEKLRESLTEFYDSQDLSLAKNSQNQGSLDLRSSSLMDADEDNSRPIQSSLITSSFSYNGDGVKHELGDLKRKIIDDELCLSKKRKLEDEQVESEAGEDDEQAEDIHEYDVEEEDLEPENDQTNDDGNDIAYDYEEYDQKIDEQPPKTIRKPEPRTSIRESISNLREQFSAGSKEKPKSLSSFKNSQPSPPRQQPKQSLLEPLLIKIGDEEIVESAYIDRKGGLAFQTCHCGSAHSQSEHHEQEDDDLNDGETIEEQEQDENGDYEVDVLDTENKKATGLFLPEEEADDDDTEAYDQSENKPYGGVSQEIIDKGDQEHNYEQHNENTSNSGLNLNDSTDGEQDLVSDPSTFRSDFNNRFLSSSDKQRDAPRNYELVVCYKDKEPMIIDEDEEKNRISELKNLAIDNIDDQEESENKLTLTVRKKDFLEMKIIGQFNLGFILVIRNSQDKQDLFIVDQHASDEKFNFETLQKTTIFDSQPLVVPKYIDLNALDELIVMDNKEIFLKNGFKFEIDEEGEPGARVKLVSLPLSKKTIFGENDFNELIHLVKESQGNTDSVRCSKIRSMFAMRACRKSIMVGRSLNTKTMTKVVRNLGQLDKPWNCPHGRPTMRHLMELEQWKPFDDDYRL